VAALAEFAIADKAMENVAEEAIPVPGAP
jgi:hypothetical protein